MKIYTVNKIEYEDDYKHRYDSGVYQTTLGTYSSYDKVCVVKMNDQIKELIESADDLFDDDDENYKREIKKYFNVEEDECGYLNYEVNLDNYCIDKICNDVFEGVFVDLKIEWEIVETTLDD